jgi:hypothetical protein
LKHQTIESKRFTLVSVGVKSGLKAIKRDPSDVGCAQFPFYPQFPFIVHELRVIPGNASFWAELQLPAVADPPSIDGKDIPPVELGNAYLAN